MKKLYCGGAFPFDCQDPDFRLHAAQDYRARILGSADALLQKSDGIRLGDSLCYIGPFYFETPDMTDRDIVRTEQTMVESCTHALFLLDDGCCPGTITELTAAALLKKEIAIFYIRRPEDQETESSLHSPCWYPITFCQLMNPDTQVFPCHSRADAQARILDYLQTI